MSDKIKAAAIQMDSVLYGKAENLKTASALVQEALAAGCRLIALPELFNTGYFVQARDYELAETIPGPTTEWMRNLCAGSGSFLVGAIIERSPIEGVLYDTSVIVGKYGVVGIYRKVYLWQNEALRFAHGNDYPVFDLSFAKIGLQICYEAGFPEGARLLALKGATVVVYSAAFSGKRSYAWELGTQARALENGVFVLAANRCGQEGEEYPFAARSRIVAPDGSILSEAQSGEQALCCEIDLAAVEAQRIEIPYLRDYNLPMLARQLNSLME